MSFLLAGFVGVTAATPACPAGSLVDAFQINGTAWAACEDLQRPDGAIVLASSSGEIEWFSKGYEPYTQGSPSDYYLNLTARTVSNAKADLLAIALLNHSQITWELVERAAYGAPLARRHLFLPRNALNACLLVICPSSR